MSPLLDVRGLSTEFHYGRRRIRILDRVSLSVGAGEALAIVGESGSGKSIAALSILRLLPQPAGRIAEGEVLFSGRDLARLGEREMRAVRGRRIGMVFQDPMTSLDPVMTIGTQITETLETHFGLAGAAARERAVQLLDAVGIPDAAVRLDDYPHQFSGGQRQRVLIAIAIACEPELLIADEPTTALDVTIQEEILDLVRRLRRERGMAVIWITHDLASIASFADRVAILYAGRVVEEAPTEELFDRPRHPYTRGLLASIVRLDRPREAVLEAIEGLPPDPAARPQGCAFHPRCPDRIPACAEAVPPLVPIDAGRKVACIRVGPGGAR